MKGKKGTHRVTGLLAAASAGLLLFGAAGTSRAALTWFSEDYVARMEVSQIGVTLVENGENVSWRNHGDSGWEETTGQLAVHMLDDEADGKLKLGKAYPEALTVTNSGDIDQYVRVTVRKYWTDANGKKTDVNPGLIHLNLAGNGWTVDESASTTERTVLYYTRALGVGETAAPLSDTLTLDTAVAANVREEETVDADGRKTIVTTWPYDGIRFVLEADVDAVQTHNAEAAIMSAWGMDVDIADNGTLSLAPGEGA